ncbi:triphosphoribosyl-dephospho-CoA synthase [Variovorax sp. OV329]|uniref:triphosphoribosyl-dephospho-CoA synthase n=1 Tax=Variovorax sp. OV329 TaxID=1882825 RepID=UPI0008E9A9DF|nr:triphosphoribosyl-dephospho-CoA synthase [Variovorax sp. OV329]SFL95087.1 triphosphoribosyl-dephospho-CoA synthase [Variovorax sp. OV329]
MAVSPMRRRAIERASACFLRACELDVAVRKPGNVSLASPGHGMTAELFIASAKATAGPLFRPGARVGERIEAAVEASWTAANCNTNLGIVLLCAPIARAVDLRPDATTPADLREAIDGVLQELDLADARAAFRAIARARPGGLGSAPDQDVNEAPSVDLRTAMALAARRDAIARLYRDGYGPLFELVGAVLEPGISFDSAATEAPPDAATVASVQRLYLALLGSVADSHIVRIHGEAVAQTVMAAAHRWQRQAGGKSGLDADPAFAEWDASLKAQRINPGTTADLTVAALLIAGLTARS